MEDKQMMFCLALRKEFLISGNTQLLQTEH